MIIGAIPFKSFKYQKNIIEGLKAKYGRIKIEIMDGIIYYQISRTLNHDQFNEF